MRQSRALVLGLLVCTLVVGSALPAYPEPPGSSAPSVPSGNASEFTLNGLACAGPDSCIAVGDFDGPMGASHPLSELWDGSRWQLLAIYGRRYSGLDGVSCPAASRCMAVGFSRYGALTEAWDGSTWTAVPSPSPAGSIDTVLLSVSCATPDSCSATGFYLNAASTWLTLAEAWDGSAWNLVPSPGPSGVAGSKLAGVSCAGPNSCMAVGDSFDNGGNTYTLAEEWDGNSWSVVPSPNSASGSEDVLTAVSCVASSQCTAVGQYSALSGASAPLVEVWNGTAWSLVAGVTGNGQLASVDCGGMSTCMAAGSYAESESGGGWTQLSIVRPAGTYGPVLNGVSCTSTSYCIGVGFATGLSSDTTYTLSEIWDGSSWALLPTPNP